MKIKENYPDSKFPCVSILFLLLMIMAQSVFADAISDFVDSKAINTPQTAVLIVDLKTGKELVSINKSKPLIPASIMKSVTTATLLEKTGAEFRYVTSVYTTGRLSDGVLEGDIIVEASGDPSINTIHNPHTADFVSEIVDALKDKNIKEVKGSIVIDESKFPGPAVNPGWGAGDLPHAYGTGTHGFNFEDNASGKKSVNNPDAVFKSKLRTALTNAGISIASSVVDADGRRHPLTEHLSANIDEIMRSCMMRSDNQFAESMLRLVGLKYGKTGSSAEGASRMMNFWNNKKADMTGVKIVDGSGLSRSNRVTATFMVDMLREMSDNAWYASFFPLAGQEGTLKKFLAGTKLDSYIAMKTGSMTGIQCYAGYKLDEDYAPTHAVVVIMNEMADRAAARKEVENLLLSVF